MSSSPFATLTMIKVNFYKQAIDSWPIFEEFAKESPVTIQGKVVDIKIEQEPDITVGLQKYGIKPWPAIVYKCEASGRTAKYEAYVSRDGLLEFLNQQVSCDL